MTVCKDKLSLLGGPCHTCDGIFFFQLERCHIKPVVCKCIYTLLFFVFLEIITCEKEVNLLFLRERDKFAVLCVGGKKTIMLNSPLQMILPRDGGLSLVWFKLILKK